LSSFFWRDFYEELTIGHTRVSVSVVSLKNQLNCLLRDWKTQLVNQVLQIKFSDVSFSRNVNLIEGVTEAEVSISDDVSSHLFNLSLTSQLLSEQISQSELCCQAKSIFWISCIVVSSFVVELIFVVSIERSQCFCEFRVSQFPIIVSI